MLTTALILFFAFYLISLLTFGVSLRRAPEGYENESGFHFGLQPQRIILARSRPARRSSRSLNF